MPATDRDRELARAFALDVGEGGNKLLLDQVEALLALHRSEIEMVRRIPKPSDADWDKRADRYLEEAMERTPQEVTKEQVAEIREAVELAEGVSAVTPLNGPLVARLLDSYEMMRAEYESSHARCMLAFDERDEVRAQLEAKANRQVVVLRLENWQRAVDLVDMLATFADGDAQVKAQKALDLLTKVDDGGVGERMEQASARVEAAIESHEPLAPAEPSYDALAGKP